MKRKELFHTLQQRYNVDDVEANGPYRCNRKDAWLSEGYYFWEHVDLAHAWGQSSHRGEYIIGSLYIEYEEDKLLDLLDYATLSSFEQSYNMLCKAYEREEITVAFVIKYLREKTKVSWKAARSVFDKSFAVQRFPHLNKSVPVGGHYIQRLNLRPPIQWCIFERSLFQGVPFSVIFESEISPLTI